MIGKKLTRDDILLLKQVSSDPSDTNVNKLMENMDIPSESKLTPDIIKNELKNPASPLSKSFNNMVINFVSEEQERQKIALQQQIVALKKEFAEEAMLEEKEMDNLATKDKFSAEQKEIRTSKTANKLRELEKDVKEISLKQQKNDDLSHWSTVFAHDPVSLATAQNIIASRYERIERNLTHYDSLLSREDLTPEQRESAQANKENYERHLELSSVENQQKYAPESMTEATGLQSLRKNEMHEELYQHFLAGNILNKVSDEDRTYEKIKSKPYQQLSSNLNDSIEKYMDHLDAENSTEAFNTNSMSKVVTLLNSINKLNANPDAAKRKEIDTQVNDTIKELNKNGGCDEILDSLEKWKKKQQEAEQFANPESKENDQDKAKPQWTSPVSPITISQNADGTKADYFSKLREHFDQKNIYETSSGFKYFNNGNQIHFDLKKNEITLNGYDEKSFEKIAKIVAQTGSQDTKSIDISRLPQKHQMSAARIAQEQGLEVVGLSQQDKEKLTAQSRAFQPQR